MNKGGVVPQRPARWIGNAGIFLQNRGGELKGPAPGGAVIRFVRAAVTVPRELAAMQYTRFVLFDDVTNVCGKA